MFGIRKVTLLSILTVGALAIAGCASGSNNNGTGTPSALTGTGTPMETAAPLPGTGGTGTPAATTPAVTGTPSVSAGTGTPTPMSTATTPTPMSTATTPTPMGTATTPTPMSTATTPTPMGTATTSTPMASNGTPSASSGLVNANTDSMYGQDLVNGDGYTLYIFKNDEPGKSNCTGTCATIWIPYTVPAGTTPTAGQGVTATLGTIQRPDGSVQVTADNLPLYTYSGDTQPGTAKGQGYNGLWFIVAPDGTAIAANNLQTTPAPTPTPTP